jgi:hypothetical protein
MSNMVDVLCEAGTACPSRAYGLTPGFFGGSVLLIILVFCVVLVWFVSVLCLVPTISVSVLCLVPTISVSFPLSVSLFCVSFPLSVSLFCVSFPLSVSLFCVSFPLSVSLNCPFLIAPNVYLRWCLVDIIHYILYIYFSCIREIWRFVHPRKVIFPEGNARGKCDYFESEQIFISPLCNRNECFIPPGQRFGEFCQMKSFGHLCLQNYYFGTSLELSLLTWKTVIWPKR